jgi:sugar O-acyltransferase (sialic acid O-acetyltransferase NeuD family)
MNNIVKKRIAFIGSGDMAKHIAHYMVTDSQFEIIGYFDDFEELGLTIQGYPVLARLNDVEKHYHNGLFDYLINAIGFTRMQYRKDTFDRYKETVPFGTFIHSTCFIDKTSVIGNGSVIFPGCIIDKNVKLDSNVFLHIGVCIAHDSTIYKHTYISPRVSVAGYVEVGERCNIGISTVIIDRVRICDGVRTGGGTVITKSINEQGTYVGVPARKINDTI